MASRMSGNSRLRRQLRMMPDEITEGITQEFKAIGPDLQDALSAAAPKDKGNMAAAAHHVVSSDGLSVVAGYSSDRAGFKRKWRKGGFEAVFNEYGTRNMPAQPFVRRTWKARIKGYLDRVDAAVNRALQKASNY